MMQASRRHPETIKMPPPREGTPGRQDTKIHQDTINFAYKQKAEKKPGILKVPTFSAGLLTLSTS